ncbi:glycosyltransferase family 2 protein [Mobiluncus mulieris]|uniref:Glycosyltransferase family 2 protein n=1 Tax=Mobiluncus mulieris TaxID=2052 RepID=A0A7Y0URZ9_9ACTO|nr:glycosyltransferase family 2 protein [Mobiluncus mulieris]MCU9968902.1 glycosyltransferase family 2 protein [Mobiluncus mulieris]MCU9971201.1 glycosyltransferase family 2 protein [Mobiluncus mulieris]MCU9973073.1 glycosyltransferase family 2 protein [Mobiluncus mulieris]MCV0008649.1 glycosyltransferase family 2 protein [Mobiluncus mulieris]NMW59973.1 glycosyltransferase family 2 protein [Mobiluncus mulieris]
MLETEKLPKVAVVIPAKDEGDSIAATVRASKAIPRADLFVVIDDGSSDNTGDAARSAGAVVVRHSVNRGKASAMETGAKVVAMRDSEEDPARLILFLDADLGDSAAETYPLVKAVMSDGVDCAIANLPKQAGAGGHGFVTRLARSAIHWATGWEPAQPLSGQRCLQPKAFFDCLPLSPSWGVETGMTIDLLVQGYSVQEVPCELTHRATGNDFAGYTHRLHQFLYVFLAATMRFIRHVRAPRQLRLSASDTQVSGAVYQLKTTG